MALTFLFAGCEPPSAIERFYEVDNAIFDNELIGTWTSGFGKDTDAFTLTEDSTEPKGYRVKVQGLGKETTGTGVLFRIQGATLMDLYPDAPSVADEATHAYFSSALRTHTVFYFRRVGNTIDVAPLADMWLAETVPQEKKLIATNRNGMVLMMRTAELQELLVKALKEPKQLFREHHRFTREGSEDAYVEMLVQGNKKLADRALDDGGFLKAGPYAEAVLAVRPEEPSMHLVRAGALIAQNKPAEARKEVATWENFCSVWAVDDVMKDDDCKKGNSEISSGMNGLAYFAEGKWQEAYDSLELFYQDFDYLQQDARLLQELALYSLNRKKEAVDLARKQKDKEQVAKFLNGELTPDSFFEASGKGPDSKQEIVAFVIASRYLADGEKAKAREWFERSLKIGMNPVYSPLAQASLAQLN